MKTAVMTMALGVSLFALARVAAGDAPSTSIALMEMGDFADGTASTAKGMVAMTPDGGKTNVAFTVSGLQPGTAHAAHIHRGSCAMQGQLVVMLKSIKADAEGNASATTSIDAAKIKGSMYFAVHQLDMNDPDGPGDVIACGDIK